VHTNKVVVDYRKMYYYRSNPDSVMHQHVNKELMKAVTNFASIGDKLINTYPELLPAVNAKKFSDSISLSIKSYSTRDDWKDDRTLLEKNIKNLRWKVPFNPKIKARVRLAGVIYCLLGYNAGTFILRSIKR
jgi:hypothetical protein